MDHTTEKAPEFEELAALVKASFPDIRCLRCGHDILYIVSESGGALPGYFSRSLFGSPVMDPNHPLLTLACTRCGHLEQHLTGVLRTAKKPIPIE